MATQPKITRDLTRTNFTKAAKNRDIKYIVIHWVGSVSTAKNNAKYFKTYRGASAHYFVDASGIVQIIEDWNVAWHCGTTNGYKHKYCRNSNSIGIEMCLDSKNHIADNTIRLTGELVRYLMEKYHVTAENVVRHFDVTGKSCPGIFLTESTWRPVYERITGKRVEVIGATDPSSNKLVQLPDEYSQPVNIYGVVDDDDGCSLRTKPNGGDKVPGYENGLPDGCVLFINAKQSGRYFVTLTNGVKGWVNGSFVAPGDVMVVNTGGDDLMMRAGRGTTYGVLKKIPKGKEVTQLRRYSNGWDKVIYDYTVGYCATRYLKNK